MGWISVSAQVARVTRAAEFAHSSVGKGHDHGAESDAVREEAWRFIPAAPEALAAARARAQSADPHRQRLLFPDLYELWTGGALRPWRLSIAMNKAGVERDTNGSTTADIISAQSWENGTTYPSWDQLVRFSALTNTSLEELFVAPSEWEPVSRGTCPAAHLAHFLRNNFHPSIVAATLKAAPHEPDPGDIAEALIDARVSAFQPMIDVIRETNAREGNRVLTDRELAATIR
jgi:hypothetical protein